MSLIALIPARSGSKRIPNKNIKDFFGHPLMAYAIQTAKDSGLFNGIYITSDSDYYLSIAKDYGAIPIRRPKELADGNRQTSEWVSHALSITGGKIFFILPITNPFRTSVTILRAYNKFISNKQLQLKSVELCRQHPEKMFYKTHENTMEALYPNLHNSPFHQLTPFYVQNACIYISKCDEPVFFGDKLTFFETMGYEGFDFNVPEDWILAEELVKRGMVKLPEIK